MDLWKYISDVDATLDSQDKFIFFGNYKAASMSINRGLLKGRAIRQKTNKDIYLTKLLSYTEADIKNMFKFTIVRNPWSRVVSAFHYLQQNLVDPDRPDYRVIDPTIPFGYFIENVLIDYKDKLSDKLIHPHYKNRFDAHFSFQYPRAYVGDNLLVDCIVRLEAVDKHWEFISSKIGVTEKTMPHTNKSAHGSYRKHYTNTTKQIVGEVYTKDIEFFNYKF